METVPEGESIQLYPEKTNRLAGSHENKGLAKCARNRMQEPDYRAEAVDQFVMPFSISLELVSFVLKQLKDSIGGVTILKLVGERIFCEVYPCLVGIVGQSFDGQVKVRRT